jgi:pyridoxamine 5'-phosphate oxidase
LKKSNSKIISVKKYLDEKDIKDDPFILFHVWLNDAIKEKLPEPTAMTLATSSKEGKTFARIVLLKKFDKRGFIFYTNYDSDKAKQINSNPNAALVFYWKELERQVRVEGIVKKISSRESDEYFNSRPVLSRISSIISPQSQVVPGRFHLENLFNEYIKNKSESEIKRPKNWGGYCLIPNHIEFWQGRENRLHDRILFTKKKSSWLINRLAP